MECDAQGIVFNGSYMTYLEVGQAEYFRNLGFSIYRIAERGYFDTAVVKTYAYREDGPRGVDPPELDSPVMGIISEEPVGCPGAALGLFR